MTNNILNELSRELLFVETAEEVNALIKNGADANGLTGKVFPLALASSIEVAQALLEVGAEVNLENKDGETAIFLNKNFHVIKFLVSKGANINHLNKNGETALFKTSEINLVKALISLGCSPFIKNKDGFRHEIKIKTDDKPEYNTFIEKIKAIIREKMKEKESLLITA